MSVPGWVLGTATGLGLVAGLLIGSIGVGGIILVPILLELPLGGTEDSRVGTAVASCMFSYIFVGLAGGWAYTRQQSVDWPSTAWVLLGVVPGGVAGAMALPYIQALGTKILLYSLVLLSAIFSLYRTVKLSRSSQDSSSPPGPEPSSPSPLLLGPGCWQGRLARATLGLLVGLGSSVTGTSGPVILLPLLLALHWPTLGALGTAQVVQLPLALAAVGGFLVQGPHHSIDWGLGACLAVGLVPGAVAGAALAHRLPVQGLRMGVAGILLLAAGALLARLVYTQVTGTAQ